MFRKLILIILACCIGVALTTGQEKDFGGKILVKADKMPIWKSCEKEANPLECTEEKLSAYIQKHLKYPKKALSQHLGGTVIISCVINKNGKVIKPNILHDIGGGCGEEALRIISHMPIWIPAKNNDDSAVNIIYNIEVPFIFNEKDIVYKEEPMKPIVPVRKPKGKSLLENETKDAMPYFSGCSELNNDIKKKRNCSDNNLIAFVANNLKYPEAAKAEGIEGIVYLSFNIDKKGNLSNAQIKRDIGGGCGEEAIRVTSLMPKWEPKIENGKPVDVEMTLPVRFSLSSGINGLYQVHWGNLKKNKITESQVEKVLTEDVIVRNRYGDDITISTLNLSYEKKSKLKEENSTGDVTLAMMRMLKKVKPGGLIRINATIQEKGEMIDIQRVFEIVK